MNDRPLPPAEAFDSRVARTTVTSFRIIEALEGDGYAGVSQLAADLSLSKGTVHKHLTTLRELDYVVREDGRYRLSLAFLGLGTSVRGRTELYEVSRDHLVNLAEATEEVASVMVPERNWGVYLSHTRSAGVESATRREGERVPLTATAGGKVILAHLPDDERDRILDERGLPALTENTVTDRHELLAELRTARDNRFAHDRGELEADLHCVAAPITRPDGTAVAAVTVSGPAERMTEKATRLDFPSIVGSTATAIQNRLTRERSDGGAADPGEGQL